MQVKLSEAQHGLTIGLESDFGANRLATKNPVYPVHPCRQKNLNDMDAQDNQDGRLLHTRLTPAMIACGFADV